MSDVVQIIIPGVPVAQGRPRFRTMKVNGHSIVNSYDPITSRKEKERIKKEVAAHMIVNELEAFDEPISIGLEFYLSIPKSFTKAKRAKAIEGRLLPAGRPDLDNYIKLILDACNGTLFSDDSLVVNILSTKRYSSNPGVIIYAKHALGKESQISLFDENFAPKVDVPKKAKLSYKNKTRELISEFAQSLMI